MTVCDVCSNTFVFTKTIDEYESIIDFHLKKLEEILKNNIDEKEMLSLWDNIFQIEASILLPNKKPYSCPANKCNACICDNCIRHMKKYDINHNIHNEDICIGCNSPK